MGESVREKNKSIRKYLSSVFWGEHKDTNLEKKLFISTSFLTLLASSIGMVWDMFIGMPGILSVLVGVFVLVYFALYYNARFRNKYSPSVYVFVSLLFLSLLYLLNGGLSGSIPALYIIFAIVFITISKAKNQLYILMISTVSLLGLFIGERFFLGNLIIPYASNETREADLAFGYTAVLILGCIIVIYFKRTIITKNKQLQALNQSKDLLFSVVAHDLRGPFNSILGLTDLMKDKSENLTIEEFQDYAELVNKESKKTYDLLESLLEWGKIQSNNMNLHPQNINLNQAISEIIQYFEEKQIIKDHKIKVKVSGEAIVFSDIVILKTILRNLISNAIKFTPAKGEIHILAEEHNAAYFVMIKDFGIGMTKEILNNLFNFEVNTNRNGINGESSVGLGLIITKALIEKQGGELIVESEKNIGSTFKFSVPKSLK